jgi:ketosteroid isomerase-like protein
VSENLEIVKAIYAEWEKGDWSSSDWADPEIEFEMVGDLIEGSWTGIAEMAKAWGRMVNAWDGLTADPEEFREIDDGRILVLLHNSGRGRESGIELEEISAKSANVFTIREGRVTKLVLYWDRDRAIEDLDL